MIRLSLSCFWLCTFPLILLKYLLQPQRLSITVIILKAKTMTDLDVSALSRNCYKTSKNIENKLYIHSGQTQSPLMLQVPLYFNNKYRFFHLYPPHAQVHSINRENVRVSVIIIIFFHVYVEYVYVSLTSSLHMFWCLLYCCYL